MSPAERKPLLFRPVIPDAGNADVGSKTLQLCIFGHRRMFAVSFFVALECALHRLSAGKEDKK